MVNDWGKAIIAEHLRLVNELARMVIGMIDGKGSDLAASFGAFLDAELLAHVQAEEQFLYPAIERLSGPHATTLMSMDHKYIEVYARQIEACARQLVDGANDAAIRMRMHHIAIQLLTLAQVHMAKEEKIYLPIFENDLPTAEGRSIYESIQRAIQAAKKNPDLIVDLRHISPSEGKEKLAKIIDAFPSEAGVMILADKDPEELRSYCEEKGWSWNARITGPPFWRVRLAKDQSNQRNRPSDAR